MARRTIMTADHYLREFARQAAASVTTGARILDAGAGDSPYRQFFAHVQYEAADLCKRDARQYEHVQMVCDLAQIPVEPDRYDLVLCTQVLEHVPRPQAVLDEFRRILRPGGHLWISAPLCFEEHEVPYDYFRYTQFGWRQMLQDSGFELVDISWVQGYLGTLAYQLNFARHQLPLQRDPYGPGVAGWFGWLLGALCKPAFGALAWIFSRMDLSRRMTSCGHPLDYRVVARRPDPAARP